MLRNLCGVTLMGDADIGDQFHNFMLHKDIRGYVGVNFKDFISNIEDHMLPDLDNVV